MINNLKYIKNNVIVEGEITGCVIEPGGFIFSSDDPNAKSILREIQKLVFFLIEETKVLKTRFVFSVDKDSKLIN